MFKLKNNIADLGGQILKNHNFNKRKQIFINKIQNAFLKIYYN